MSEAAAARRCGVARRSPADPTTRRVLGDRARGCRRHPRARRDQGPGRGAPAQVDERGPPPPGDRRRGRPGPDPAGLRTAIVSPPRRPDPATQGPPARRRHRQVLCAACDARPPPYRQASWPACRCLRQHRLARRVREGEELSGGPTSSRSARPELTLQTSTPAPSLRRSPPEGRDCLPQPPRRRPVGVSSPPAEWPELHGEVAAAGCARRPVRRPPLCPLTAPDWRARRTSTRRATSSSTPWPLWSRAPAHSA